MANKTHGTRQKLTFKLPAIKPRNPLVVEAGKRKAGSHTPDKGAVRQAQKRQVKKLLDNDS
jgi:hypothetical protein